MPGTIRTRVIEKWKTPVDALRLTEDIAALRLCQRLLDSVEPANVTYDPASGRDGLGIARNWCRQFERFAEAKLRKDYLAPQEIFHRRLNKPQRKVSN